MCCGCWQQAGSPKIVNEQVLALAKAVPDIDPYGHLHIIVDDMNVENSHIEFCAREVEQNTRDESENERRAERQFLQLMGQLTIPERYSALGIADGCFTPD